MIRGKLPRTEERLKAVARHQAAGVSIVESARILGVTERTVTRLRARNRGYAMEQPVPLTAEQLATFEARLNEGWSYREIGRTYGVSEQRVAKHFPGRGWDSVKVGQHGAMGKLMNAIPTFAEPASRTNFASLKTTQFKTGRRWHKDRTHHAVLAKTG